MEAIHGAQGETIARVSVYICACAYARSPAHALPRSTRRSTARSATWTPGALAVRDTTPAAGAIRRLAPTRPFPCCALMLSSTTQRDLPGDACHPRPRSRVGQARRNLSRRGAVLSALGYPERALFPRKSVSPSNTHRATPCLTDNSRRFYDAARIAGRVPETLLVQSRSVAVFQRAPWRASLSDVLPAQFRDGVCRRVGSSHIASSDADTQSTHNTTQHARSKHIVHATITLCCRKIQRSWISRRIGRSISCSASKMATRLQV